MTNQNTDNQVTLVEFPASNPQDLQKAVDFYTPVFGWQYKDWGGVYSDTSDSGVMTGIAVEQNRPNKPLAVIYASNLDEKKEAIRQAGGTIIIDTYDFPGGRRFHFTDPLGNELAVWSDQ